jgi:hypothetical protein
MAANPKPPNYSNIPPRQPLDDHAKVDLVPRQTKFPWPIFAFIVGLVILAVIIYVVGRHGNSRIPAGAEAPRQPTGQQVQLTNVQMVPSPAGGAMYLEAVLHNAGNSAIIGLQVIGNFIGDDGRPLRAETSKS